MHLPDGYLSPSTCAGLWAAAVPFWSVALRRIRVASARAIPLLSFFAAFSFVIMMFNIPLPGGTTGHATGIALAAVVLGPAGAIVAISVALLIQALLFGDGGVVAYGANAFNIAIVGTLVAAGTYRLLAHGSALASLRRPFAAAAGGYLGINAAALLTALELGMQPALFRAADGTPLYAPYPLSVALPAMMVGHLLVAGVAEALLTGGVVRYLQRAHPELLEQGEVGGDAARGAGSLRPLWIGLAVVMIATPLGLLAAGAAWGEWSAADFDDPEGRAGIAAASGGAAPPASAPRGIERLSAIWRAPLDDYAPSFLRNPSVGYLFSAMVGTGAIILLALFIARIARPPLS